MSNRNAVFTARFLDDLAYWIKIDRKTALRLVQLVKAISEDPFNGIGKPEPLKYTVANTWSRRLTQEHRVVYRVPADRIDFLQARYHY